MSNRGEQAAEILRDLEGKHICGECADTFKEILVAIRQLPKESKDQNTMTR